MPSIWKSPIRCRLAPFAVISALSSVTEAAGTPLLSSARVNGTYQYVDNIIQITATSPNQLQVSFDLTSRYRNSAGPTAATGTAAGTAKLEGVVATYNNTEFGPCQIKIQFTSDNGLEVNPISDSADCGFSPRTSAAGHYRKTKGALPPPDPAIIAAEISDAKSVATSASALAISAETAAEGLAKTYRDQQHRLENAATQLKKHNADTVAALKAFRVAGKTAPAAPELLAKVQAAYSAAKTESAAISNLSRDQAPLLDNLIQKLSEGETQTSRSIAAADQAQKLAARLKSSTTHARKGSPEAQLLLTAAADVAAADTAAKTAKAKTLQIENLAALGPSSGLLQKQTKLKNQLKRLEAQGKLAPSTLDADNLQTTNSDKCDLRRGTSTSTTPLKP